MSRSEGRRLAGRAGWNLADQVVSSGTNLLLSLLVARALSAEGFGSFALAFAVYSFLIGASRALVAQPLTVRFVSRGPEVFHAAARAATGAAGLLGLAAAAVLLVVGLLLGGATGTSLVAIGVLMPGLLVQDMWRAVFVAEGRPRSAFVNDVVWAVVQFAAVGALIAAGQVSGTTMIAGWGAAALLAAVVGGFQFRGHPAPGRSVPWLRGQKDLLGYYAASFLAVLGANQITLFLLAGFGSPTVVGALRAAQVVLGPLNLAGYSLVTFAVPEIARRGLSGRRALQAGVLISAVMVTIDLVWGLTLILLPPQVGGQLLGDSWASAQAVLPASLLGIAAIGVGLGASVLMQARGFAKESFRLNVLLAPGYLVLGIGGLAVGGAVGAALGLSLAQVVVVPLFWWRIVVLMRRETALAAEPGSTRAG